MIKSSDNFFTAGKVLEYTQKRTPDFNNLLLVLDRKVPARPTLFEFFMNENIYKELTGLDSPPLSEGVVKRISVLMHAFRNAGYDYITVPAPFLFPIREHPADKSFSLNETSMIRDRKSFDEYPWPDIGSVDFSYMSDLEGIILPGMKCITYGPCGVLENATQILGYENMCYLIYDDPKLVSDVFERIGEILLEYYGNVLDYNCVGASIVNDDWGYRTQTLLKAEDMRKYVMPWHKKIVERIHKSGKPAILHSCGQLDKVYDDIIDDIGFDAKHSYEDAILPVEEFYERYKSRIAVLGGIDLNFVCTKTPEEVYERSVSMIKTAGVHGGYAHGTGNSVPVYVPHANYYALILAALTL